MARGYRSRRYRVSRRYARRPRKSSSLKRIKKDILKCNFPTKVKFMGLTERKVMYLTKDISITELKNYDLSLNPLDSDNIETIVKERNLKITDAKNKLTGNFTVNFSNWDKICILGIYIKFQPMQNMWTTNGINTVKCTYTSGNCPKTVQWISKDSKGDEIQCSGDFASVYDKENLKNKQVFTFNSNEAFTIYLAAPTTMWSDSPVVHKSKTWWSITDLDIPTTTTKQMENEDDSDDISEEMEQREYPDIGTPIVVDGNEKSLVKPILNAGRLYFESAGAAYNITINYKVALKG